MIADQIAKNFGLTVNGSPQAFADCVDDIKGTKKNSLSFIADSSYLKYLPQTNSTILIVSEQIEKNELDKVFLTRGSTAYLVSTDAYKTFIEIINKMIPEADPRNIKKIPDKSISATAKIDSSAKVYPNVFIDDNVTIRARTIIFPGVVLLENTVIGEDVVLYPNVVVYKNTRIGNRVIIGSSTVIGSDGFGFIRGANGTHIKVPHVGGVIIQDDVEIGSNTSVDRGTVGDTIIKKGTKIDNLVQVAHNCILGENNIICGMSGLSGSTELGNNVIMGAGSGTKGHIKIGDNCIVTARTSVSKDLKAGSEVKGMYPARPVAEEIKIQMLVGKLPEIYERLKKLEKGGQNQNG